MTSDRFEIQDAGLLGLKLIRRRVLEDPRGSLSRLYAAEAFEAAGFTPAISQINRTCTRRTGTVRGLHFQLPPHAEVKVVTCLRGRVFDVAVDLRRGSPTFLQWKGVILSEADPTSLLIPPGFAHGLQTLEEDCELLYLHSAPYHAESEGGVHPADPALAIAWPLAIRGLSERDRGRPFLPPQYEGMRP